MLFRSDFEFRLLELPQPDLVLYLDVEPDAARRQMEHRQQRTETQGDIHERDFEYLCACREAGCYAAEHYGWQRIPCMTPAGEMRSIAEIHTELYHRDLEVL